MRSLIKLLGVGETNILHSLRFRLISLAIRIKNRRYWSVTIGFLFIEVMSPLKNCDTLTAVLDSRSPIQLAIECLTLRNNCITNDR